MVYAILGEDQNSKPEVQLNACHLGTSIKLENLETVFHYIALAVPELAF